MKYTKAERLEIGRRIYEGELNKFQAAEEYDIGYTTARNYMRSYRYANGLPAKSRGEYVHSHSISIGRSTIAFLENRYWYAWVLGDLPSFRLD